ncbi:MAG TPA: ankyrin repeat domain-containing protein [Steroidobacteraceae bacterium]|nr:ankyrin repeat domain-containing protein [Steroidobacteraceae bacterium]
MFKLAIRASAVAAAIGVLSLGAAAFSYADSAPQTLTDLIRTGQRDAVLAAITSPDIDVNAADPDGSTPLLWATYTVDHELVQQLLKKGAKAKVTNHYGATPLTEAVKVGDVDMARMLLDAGADANSPNLDGETALMLASSIGSMPIAQMLIAHGASVNAIENFRGQNALMWAAAENHPDVVDLLLAHGAGVNLKLRAKYDDWPREMTSEPRAQFNQTGGLTALLYATRSGCYRCAVAIVKAGADVNEPNPDGITPLINALDSRDYDIAMFLLDKGANPSVWDMNGRTPIYVAVDMNSYRGRGFGGPTGFAGYASPTAAHPKSTATAMDLVNRLLAMGVDPNHQLTRMRPNGNGRGRFEDYMMRGGTGPVMIAALAFDDVALKALLAHGAEADVPNVFAITPLMAVAGMSGAGRGNGPQQGDLQARALKVMDLLVAAGANVNARVTDSHTHTAKLVAYVQGRDHEGQTALFSAAEAGWDRVTKYLLDHGADAKIRDATGKIALDFARKPSPVGPGVAPVRANSASRAATIALLEPFADKPPAAAPESTASASP